MKGLETALFAASLLLVPALAWTVGRVIGRRDWRIASVVAMGCVVAFVPHLLRIALLARLDTRPFSDALLYQGGRAFANAEVGMFFTAFSVFMTMLGWTATPALQTSIRT